MNRSRFNPFPGLRPFRMDEKHLFFGREKQTRELLQRLRNHRFLAVVGTSGSGKSSLVQAGLLPQLYGGAMLDAGFQWEVAVMRPGGAPLTHLAEALVETDLYDPDREAAILETRATLSRSGLGMVEAVRQSDIEAGSNLLVVVDQFEELFRFRGGSAANLEEASAFVNLLLRAADQNDMPIYIALTMRSDYLGDCAEFAGLAEAVNDGEYLIPRLSRQQRRTAIAGPVKVGGGEIAPRLLQKLLNDVGDNPDHLPVLQHALMRTWDHWEDDHAEDEPMDLRHYESVGGMAEALSRHADEVYDELPDDAHRSITEKLFKALTERSTDNRGIRRPGKLRKLCAMVDADQRTVITIIEAFRKMGRTFLMPTEGVSLEGETVIDLSHESLMRVWRRLDGWVEEESQSARIYGRLRETAELHNEAKAGLYHDPDLQIAQSWRDESQPNDAWATQYGGEYDSTMAFLDQSEEAARKSERENEATRLREVEQAKTLAKTQQSAARNFKRFAMGMGVVALLAMGAMIFAIQNKMQADKLRENAEQLRIQADHQKEEAVDFANQTHVDFARSDHSIGESLINRGEPKRGIAYLARSLDRVKQQPGIVDRIFNVLAYKAPPRYESPPLDYGEGILYASVASTDGAMVVTATPRSVRAWSPYSNKPLYQKDFALPTGAMAAWYRGLALSPDKGRLFIGGVFPGSDVFPASGSFLVDLPRGELVKAIDHSQLSRPGDFIPQFTSDGEHMLLTRYMAQKILLLDGRTAERIDEWDYTGAIAFLNPDESQFQVASGSKVASVEWRAVPSGEVLASIPFQIPKEGIDDSDFSEILGLVLKGSDGFLVVSPNGERGLAFDSGGSGAAVYDTKSGEILSGLGHGASDPIENSERYHREEEGSIVGTFTRDGQRVITVSTDRTVRLWSSESSLSLPEPLSTVAIAHQMVRGHPIPTSADGRRFMVPTRDGGCYYGEFAMDAPDKLPNLTRKEHINDGYAFLADSGKIKPLLYPQHFVVAATMDASKKTVAIGSGEGDGRVALYDIARGERRGNVFYTGASPRSMAFSQDGSKLAIGTDSGRVLVREIDQSNAPQSWAIDGKAAIQDLRFTPDGNHIVAVEEARYSVWEVASGARIREQRITEGSGFHEISLNGATLLTVMDSVGILTDTLSGALGATLEASDEVTIARFNSDASLVAMASIDKVVRVWTTSGDKVVVVDAEEKILDVDFSDDGNTLALMSIKGGSIHRIDPGSSPVQLAFSGSCRRAVLSPDGRMLAAVIARPSETYGMVWDTRTGELIADGLPVGRDISGVSFVRGGQQALFWPDSLPESPLARLRDGHVSLWDVSVSGGEASPDWLTTVAPILGSRKLNDEGRMVTAIGREIVSQEIESMEEDDPLKRFFEWTLAFPGTRSDSPFRSKVSEDYVQSLIWEMDLSLLDAAVRLRPRNALALARRAAFRLISNEDLKDAATRALSKADYHHARALAPKDPEIAWYRWLTMAKLGVAEMELTEALERARALGELDDTRLLAFAQCQQLLRVGGEELDALLTQAIENNGGGDSAVKLRIARLQRTALVSDFALVEEDWQVFSNLTSLPEDVMVEDLLDRYLDARQRKAERLYKTGAEARAVSVLRPVVLIREIMAPLPSDGESRESWSSTLIRWEDPDNQLLIPEGATWHFNDEGDDLGTAWREPDYEEANEWNSGRAALGFGDSYITEPELNGVNDESGESVISYYFRHEFTYQPSTDSKASLSLELKRDDGAILYLNGKEILRDNLPAGPVNFQTLATDEASNEGQFMPFLRSAGALQPGRNVLAAEVHQSRESSSDLGFDLILSVTDHTPSTYFEAMVASNQAAQVSQAAEALMPRPLLNSWRADRDFIISGELGNHSLLEFSEHRWLRRYAFWESRDGLERALVTVEQRLQALEGQFAAPKATLRHEWLARKESLLVRMEKPREEIQAATKAVLTPPIRDPSLSPKLLDLTDYYTNTIYDARRWSSLDLKSLTDSFIPRHGVSFDLRGLVQLNGGVFPDTLSLSRRGRDRREAKGGDVPDRCLNIAVNQKSPAIHFLMSCQYGRETEVVEIARLIMHYEDGSPPERQSVRWQNHVLDWVLGSELKSSMVGWRGRTNSGQSAVTLSEIVWENPHPEKTISHIDFESALKLAEPFLVGITLE